MQERWKPSVTVAAIIERQQDGQSQFMLVEELTRDRPALYVSGEESLKQTRMRADRLGVKSQHLHRFKPHLLQYRLLSSLLLLRV
jgi:hypothetical protein